MRLSVIIPSKTASNLGPCVAAVRQHEPACDVIVIDDAVGHGSFGGSPVARVIAESPDATFSWATWIRGEKPFVFARNINRGIDCAFSLDPKHHEYDREPAEGVVLLNDDALLQTPGGFAKLAEFAAAHEDCGAVVPATNITGQPLQWPANATEEGFRWCQSVPYVCVYIPRRTLNAVGPLDERYCLDYGCEDQDHCEAMKRAGLKVAILYSVYVDHGSLRSSFRGDPKTPASFVRNQALFNEKWGIA